MYLIQAHLKKKFRDVCIKKRVDTDSYEAAMDEFNDYLKKRNISEEKVLSYTVIRSIKCNRCQNIIDIYDTTNTCECGAVYDYLGNEIKTTAEVK